LALALARIREDRSWSLWGPASGASGSWYARWISDAGKIPRTRAYLAAGALSIVLAGIGVNALVFQRERHPAPFFGSPQPHPTVIAAPAPEPPQITNAERGSGSADKPQIPAPEERVDAAPPARQPDAITDLLRREARTDEAHLIVAAQTALSKLGYSVKPDGNQGEATNQSLLDFERAHGLAPTTEISPSLVKRLERAIHTKGR
jgi:hypothetical protein